ncbi:MAG TPA: hypothetical protein VG673_17420, partial [Actinomycetota bacterium]|nr:hypothetical protein [Actinomycetota bacterium]
VAFLEAGLPGLPPVASADLVGPAQHVAARLGVAAGHTEEAGNLLRRGDRLGRDFQRLARQAGFQECNEALPL